MVNYKESTAYKSYIQPDTRWEAAPVFQMDTDGNPIVPHGEVFCRMPMKMPDGEITICPDDKKYTTNLMRHVKSHDKVGRNVKVEIPAGKAGGLSQKTHLELIYFYKGLHATCNASEGAKVAVVVTPSRSGREQQRATTPPTPSPEPQVFKSELNPRTGKANMAKMHRETGIKSCAPCRKKGLKTCPGRRSEAADDCKLWAKFEVADWESGTENTDDGDNNSDSPLSDLDEIFSGL